MLYKKIFAILLLNTLLSTPSYSMPDVIDPNEQILQPSQNTSPILISEPTSPKQTLANLSAQFFNAYREYSGPGSFQGISMLNKDGINKVFDKFFINFRTKVLSPQWIDFDIPNFPYEEYKHPYVQKIKAAQGSKFCFIGDIHGSVHSLLRCLWRLVALGYLDKKYKIIKPNFYMIFLGDYVDRGRYGLETLYILTKLKNKNWNSVFLIRGNHETQNMNERDFTDGGGFFDELARKFPTYHTSFRSKILALYQRLPLALYIVVNSNIIKCVHGGFAPYGYYFDDKIKELAKEDTLFYRYINLTKTDLTFPGYQWCDFEQNFAATENLTPTQVEGRIWKMGEVVAEKILQQTGIDALFRGHQHNKYGLKMLFSSAQLSSIATLPDENVLGLYRWTNILRATSTPGKNMLQEHSDNPDGFAIGNYLPIFTFSSAPEGVGSDFDCFGILTTRGPFKEWRLKIYEVGFPPQIRNNFDSWYVTIKKKTHPADGDMPSAAGRVENPIAEFYNPDQSISTEKLERYLNEI